MRAALALAAALAAGCDWSLHRMQHQPGCRVEEATDLLPGGACAVPPPAGIVPFEPAPSPAPPAVTRALVERGRTRFDAFCAPCHGLAGDGDSYVARAMTLRKPPSLVDAGAAALSDDHVLTVMATGYGLMPAYAAPLSPADRHAILHYVRALQHREVELSDLPAALREEATRWLR